MVKIYLSIYGEFKLMDKDWETVFTSWANGPSESEQQRAENAESQIREAIRSSDKLKNRNIVVFT